MQASQIPTKFNIPFANGAPAANINAIPQASQIAITLGAASLTDGFPPACLLPVGAGGVPPYGRDMNGILNQITAWLRWQEAGGGVLKWDNTFGTAIGGYPLNALVQGTATIGTFWLSTVDNNTTDPDTGGVGWLSFGSNNLTGDFRWLNGSATGTTMTAQWSVQEIIAKTSVGGASFIGSNLTLTFNGTATAGPGAMDVGVLSAGTKGSGGTAGGGIGGNGSGIFFSVYAIYNGTAGTWNTLGTLAGSGLVYTGSAMPTGYTASCLLYTGGCGGTGGGPGTTGKINAFYQIDRKIFIPPINTLSGGTQLTWTTFSVATAVPSNARSCSGLAIVNAASANIAISVFPVNTVTQENANSPFGVGQVGDPFDVQFVDSPFTDMPCPNSTLYYILYPGGSTVNNVWINAYVI